MDAFELNISLKSVLSRLRVSLRFEQENPRERLVSVSDCHNTDTLVKGA